MKISEEVRAQVDLEERENAKRYAKSRVERQLQIRKSIEHLEEEFTSIQEELDRIDKNDFSKVPNYFDTIVCGTSNRTITGDFNNTSRLLSIKG